MENFKESLQRLNQSPPRAMSTFIVFFWIIGALVYVFSPSVYEGKTTLIATERPKGGLTGMLGNVGEASLLTALGGMGLDQTSENLVNLLLSDELSRIVVKKSDLVKFYKIIESGKNADEVAVERAAQILRGDRRVGLSKEGLITVAVRITGDAEMAASTANNFLDALQDRLNTANFSDGARERESIESQIVNVKRKIADLNLSLLNFSRESQTVLVRRDFLPLLDELGGLTSAIAANELEKTIYDSYLAANSAEPTASEASHLREQLLKDERLKKFVPPSSGARRSETLQIAINKSPILTLHYSVMREELERMLKILGALQAQREEALVQEHKERKKFQVIDHAIPIDIKIWPRAGLIFLVSTLVGFCLWLAARAWSQSDRSSRRKA